MAPHSPPPPPRQPRRSQPIAPLLTFPPSPPRSHSPPPPHKQRRRSPLTKFCLTTPLFFIFTCFIFAFYAFEISLVFDYLLLSRHAYFKSLFYSIIFLWFWSGAVGGVTMAAWTGGGRVLPLSPSPSFPSTTTTTAEAEARGLLAGGDEEEEEEEEERKMQSPGAVARSRTGFDVGAALRELEEGHAGGEGGGEGKEERGGVQVKSDGRVRWCRKCQLYKPDRAHHCSSCGFCVLKMDHHCPWLGGGCVGYANYKFFVLFLLYTGTLGVYVAAVMLWELMSFVAEDEQNFELAPITWALALFLGFIFGFCVGLFGLYHLYLLLSNRTTIESMERSSSFIPSNIRGRGYRPDYELSWKERRMLEKASGKLNVYDLGWRGNAKSVLGGDWRWWGVPWGAPPGDGRTFPIDREKLAKLREVNRRIRFGGREETSEGTEETDTMPSESESGSERDVVRRA